MIDIGMLIEITIVLPMLRKKNSSTTTASSPPEKAESATPLIARSMKSAVLMIA